MEDGLPPFLARLGLNEQTDDRAIRRAYARLLKQIDQEADPAGFQSLREAYEVALGWHAQRSQAEAATPTDDATGPAPESPAANDGRDREPMQQTRSDVQPTGHALPSESPARPSSEQVARSQLQVLMDQLATGRLQTRDEVTSWLESTLESDPLVDMDARFLFEWGIAAFLADGWAPRKDILFSSVMKSFSWQADRTRLAAFGQPGRIITAAIAEIDYFDCLQYKHQNAQRDLIRRLRDRERPSTAMLLDQIPTLDRIVQLYPHWLHVITDTSNIARWREWERQIPRWRRWLSRSGRRGQASPPRTGSRLQLRWVSLALMALLFVAKMLSSSAPSSRPPASQGMDAGQPQLRAGSAPPAWSTFNVQSPPAYLVPPAPVYPPEARRAGQQGRVVLEVYIDASGRPQQPSVLISSGHAALDQAAVSAVLKARFQAAKDVTGSSTAGVYRIPINFKLDNAPATRATPRPYGEAVRNAILPNIVFSEPVSGNPVAEVQLWLATDGRIERHALIKSSGNKAWDTAVLRGIGRVPRLPLDQDGKVPPQLVISFRPKA